MPRNGLSSFWRRLLFDASSIPCRFLGEVKGFDPRDFLDQKEVKKMARLIQFAIAASEFAIAHARLQMQKENAEVSVGQMRP
jgi:3-oxoacyl-[acyl-carrier-protein] synthase II